MNGLIQTVTPLTNVAETPKEIQEFSLYNPRNPLVFSGTFGKEHKSEQLGKK